MKTAVISVVKNVEGRIEEWCAYQLAFGFDAVILLNNGSTDSTRAVIERMIASGAGDIRLFEWSMTNAGYQTMGFEWAMWRHRDEFDWVACLDADEFMSGFSIPSMLDVPRSCSAIMVPWAVFGSSGLDESPELVVPAFIQRARDDHWDYHHVKSFVRPSCVIGAFNSHHFHVHGSTLDTRHLNIVEPSAVQHSQPSFAHGKVNHYFVQSRADFQAKIDRGYHDHPDRRWDEFDQFNRNEVQDTDALIYLESTRALMERFRLPNPAN